MPDRATLTEVLDFANRVREAGGANPLDALIPAVPEEPNECLIAKNLNFNCQVDGVNGFIGASADYNGAWCMIADDDTVATIAAALKLDIITDRYERKAVVLPRGIGAVAAAYDEAAQILATIDSYYESLKDYKDNPEEWSSPPSALVVSDSERELLEEMWPYIAAAVRETYALAGEHITPDGKIIL